MNMSHVACADVTPRRSAAGGETGAPRAQRGTRLKATTERAFLVSLALQRSAPKRLVHLAGRAEREFPAPIQGGISGEEACALAPVPPSHARRQGSGPRRRLSAYAVRRPW